MRKFVWNIVMRINLHLKINILKIIKNILVFLFIPYWFRSNQGLYEEYQTVFIEWVSNV